MPTNRIKTLCLFLVIMLQIIGCSSPQDEANNYIKSGYKLLDSGEFVGAGIQFKNALQIDKDLASAWYGLSLVEEKQGHLDKVYYTLTKVVELEPNNVNAHLKLGKIILAGKLIDKALKKSDLLLNLSPDDPNVRAFRALVLLELSDKEGAKKEAKIALEKNPENIDAFTVLALERMSGDDYQGAKYYLDRGLKYDDKNIVLQSLKINVLNTLNDKKAVINVFKSLISQYPDNKNFRYSLAKYYIENDRLAEAEGVYKNLIDRYPTDIAAIVKFIKFTHREYGLNNAVSLIKYYISKNPTEYELKFQLAELYLLDKDNTNAENIYYEIIEENKTGNHTLSAKNKLALLALHENKLEKANKIINDVLLQDSNNKEALITRATINLQKHNIDKAIIDLRNILTDYPDNVEALMLLAQAYQNNNSYELARDTYNRAIQIDPQNEKSVINYSRFLVQNKQLNMAEEILTSYLEKNPSSIFISQELAKIYLMNGKWLKAHELAEYIKKSGDTVIADQILGAAYQGQQQFDLGIQAFKRAYQASPASVQPLIAVVRSYVIAGKRDEAISFLRSVIEVHPSNLYANILLGQGHEIDNDMIRAELHFKNAIEYNPDQPLGYEELARFYVGQGKYKAAQDTLDKGLENLPGNLAINLAIARLHEKAGDNEKAIAQYEKILNENSNIDLAANNLASILSENYDDEKSLNRAYKLASKFQYSSNPYFRDTLGWVYYKMGKFDNATSLLKDVVNSMPGISIFHFHLGMSLLAEGERDMAKIELEKAIAISDQTFVDKSIAVNALNKL